MGRKAGTVALPYLKGHMGGNTIALFPEGVLPETSLMRQVLLALRGTHLHCHEAGLLSPSSDLSTLKLRIVGRTSKGFITACGGLTQVLGAAIGTGKFREKFGFGPSGTGEVTLESEGGPVVLRIFREEDCDGIRTETDMTSFLEELRRDGIEHIVLGDIRAVRAGKFLVLDAEELAERFPPEKIRELHSEVGGTLAELQRRYLTAYPKASYDFALFDLRPERKEHLGRLVFPHAFSAGHIEPACGTGTVAVCAALEFLGKIGEQNRLVRFESGGGPTLGGPETTTAFLHWAGSAIASIGFSHSVVTVTSEGMVMLPEE